MKPFSSIRLSPLTQKRLQNFFRMRRARWSLILLGALFGISLVSELICNSRPLVLRVNGRLFFPFVQNLTRRDLLGPGRDARQLPRVYGFSGVSRQRAQRCRLGTRCVRARRRR